MVTEAYYRTVLNTKSFSVLAKSVQKMEERSNVECDSSASSDAFPRALLVRVSVYKKNNFFFFFFGKVQSESGMCSFENESAIQINILNLKYSITK